MNRRTTWLLDIIDSVSVAMTGMLLAVAAIVIPLKLMQAIFTAEPRETLIEVLHRVDLPGLSDFVQAGWATVAIIFLVTWAIFRWKQGWEVIKRSNPH